MTNIIMIACISVLFFWRTLNYGYSSDDIPVYHATKDKYKNNWIKRIFFGLTGEIRITPKIDHALGIILHTIVCVLIYTGFGMNTISLIAALLFMVNPANNQGSIWISGRGYVLPTLLLLASISAPYLSPLFVLLATYFHTGFLTPLMFAVSPFRLFLLVLPFAWLFWSKKFRRDVKQKVKQEMFGEDKKIKLSKLILFFKTLGYYSTLVVFPFRVSFYHAYMQSMAGNELMKKRAYRIGHFFFIGISVLVALSYIILQNPTSYLSLACAWWLCGIAPYCNLFRFQQEIASRYCYLPLVGSSFILAYFLIDFPVIISFLLAMYATRLWTYMPAYKDDYFLSETARLNSRDAWFPWHIAAMKRWDTQSYKEAVVLWVMAKNISPHEFKILFNIATCLMVLGQKKEAQGFYNLAKKHIPLGQEEQIAALYKDVKNGKVAIVL